MTDVIQIRAGRSFIIKALSISGTCHVLEFMDFLEQSNPAEYIGISALLERSADNGLPHNDHKCRSLGDKLFEFKYKHTRLLFFYTAGQIIICTHGFWKQGQKTPRKEINKAKELRKRYLEEHNG